MSTPSDAPLPGKREMHVLEDLTSHRYSHVEEIMGDASRALANLCKYTGIVVEPKIDFMLFKEVEFVKLSKTTILAVFVTFSGMVHTRLVNTEEEFPQDFLSGMKGYMNERCEGLPFYSLRKKDIGRYGEGQGGLPIAHGQNHGRPRTNHGQGRGAREVYLEGTSRFIGVPELSDINQAEGAFSGVREERKSC